MLHFLQLLLSMCVFHVSSLNDPLHCVLGTNYDICPLVVSLSIFINFLLLHLSDQFYFS